MKVMVLNDGETWSDLAGCKVVDLPGKYAHGEELQNGRTVNGTPIPTVFAFTGDEFEDEGWEALRIVCDAAFNMPHSMSDVQNAVRVVKRQFDVEIDLPPEEPA